jgi:superfamily II DNA helicase RecQ
MGMDHPQLRWVLCLQAPPSLLTLAQAIGRAGRSPLAREQGRSCVFWDEDDLRLVEWTAEGSTRRKQELAEVEHFLRSTKICREKLLISLFEKEQGATLLERCMRCDVCLGAISAESQS